MFDEFDSTDDNYATQGFQKAESAESTAEVRKRIEELLEKKRLKEMLDDTDSWEL